MKIALVTHRLGFQGGAELFVRDLALGLARRGHTTRLLHGEQSGRDPAEYTRAFTETRAKDAADARTGLDAAYVMKALDAAELAFLGDLPIVVGAHDHDQTCIRAHRYVPIGNEPCHRTPGASCWLHGCGVVRDRSGSSLLGVTLADPFARRRKLRALAARASLAACSRYVADQLVRAGAPPSRVRVVHPIPPPNDTPRVPRPKARRLLVVGQLVHGKGVDLALRALARLPSDVTLDVVGEGPSGDALRALAQELVPGRVRFVGYAQPADMVRHYDAARVVVVPSRWPEPFGMVGVEALRRGRPVVAARHGGIPEWLDERGGSAIGFTPGDVAELARGLARVLDDEGLEERAVAFAASAFSHDDAVDELLAQLAQEASYGRAA